MKFMPGSRLAYAAAVGSAAFLATAIVAQINHPRAVAATPISTYLTGAGGGWLQGGYYALAVALGLLGFKLAFERPSAWPCLAGAMLAFAGGAVVLVAYSYGPWPLPGNPGPRLRVAIHVASAFVAFFCVTLAMFAATPLLWKRRLRGAFYRLASLVLALELAGVFAPDFAPEAYGAFEKLAIVGIVLWLIAAALTLARIDRAGDRLGSNV